MMTIAIFIVTMLLQVQWLASLVVSLVNQLDYPLSVKLLCQLIRYLLKLSD